MSDASDVRAWRARAEALEAENETLRYRLAEAMSIFESKCKTPAEWGLTSQQARIFAALLSSEIATHQQIRSAAFFGAEETEWARQHIACQVTRMRAKLKPFGMEIHPVYERGYRMTGAKKIRVGAESADALDPRLGAVAWLPR